uniref:Uncharacterized protein n=1 Tax=Arundo donax TaxID=35708 RepID=A0A0A8Z898_ARUDO
MVGGLGFNSVPEQEVPWFVLMHDGLLCLAWDPATKASMDAVCECYGSVAADMPSSCAIEVLQY